MWEAVIQLLTQTAYIGFLLYVVSDAWSFISVGFLISVGWHADADNSTLGLGDFFFGSFLIVVHMQCQLRNPFSMCTDRS